MRSPKIELEDLKARWVRGLLADTEYKARLEQMSDDEIKRSSVEFDSVEKPKHYNVHPSGVECIQITEYMSFCLGNAVKYIWRADEKNGIEDLKKAVWYLQREIALREQGTSF